MTRIQVRTELRYDVHTPTQIVLALRAVQNRRQHVSDEHLSLTPPPAVDRLRLDRSGHELDRTSLNPGPLTVTYEATVNVQPHVPDDAPHAELPLVDLPADVLAFLNPSRYCQSDLLGRFATRTFGALAPGFERVTGICNWIWEHLTYEPGATDGSTTAIDVLVGSAGVCRDYAHLGISLCRALGIPARYVSGYAVDLEPPDFHGFFEAYLADEWYLFDATRMAPVDGLVRIATGRDAADVAFAAIVGSASLTAKHIVVTDLDRTAPRDPTATPALGTA